MSIISHFFRVSYKLGWSNNQLCLLTGFSEEKLRKIRFADKAKKEEVEKLQQVLKRNILK